MPAVFNVPRRIEAIYRREISKAVSRSIKKPNPEQSYSEWLSELGAYSQSEEAFGTAWRIASGMVRMVNIQNARSWREAASRSLRPQALYRALQKELGGIVGQTLSGLVSANARLISSIPAEAAERLTGEIARAQQAGARPETIAKMMRIRFPELTRSRVKLIARTETMKASTSLTRARCDELDIPAYEWLTSEDQRVRPSHRNMDGVIVFWNDPPSPEALIHIPSTLGHYHSGDSPNCRCTVSVILSLDDVSWPHRVYHDGRISSMGRIAFSRMFSGQLIAQ